MTLSYAGVTLPVPTAENVAWVEANLSLNDILEFSRLNWPSFSLSYIAFPGSLEQRNKIRLGRLFWPRGASRWAMAHFIVDDDTLAAIRTALGSTYTAQPFIMTWVNAITGLEVDRITTHLFMLPPRPLSQIFGSNGHWVLTLVDDRFFWWQRSTGALAITEGTTTWADLYTALGAQLGFIITADAVPAAYLKPSFFLGIPYAYTPILLDAVAFNCGQRITRALDGTIRARNPVNAAADVAANRALATAAFKQAGGVFNFNPALVFANDDPGLLPFEVTITFPQVNADSGSNVPTGGLLAVSATLASLGLIDIPPMTPTSGGAKVFHDTASAAYLASVLQNGAELNALVTQMATDWYRFQLAPLDVKLAGIVNWNPDALHDWVEWSYAAYGGPQLRGDACTRICRTPFNDLTDELQHGDGAGGQSQPPGTGLPPPYPPGSPSPPSPVLPVYPPYPEPPGGGSTPVPPGVSKLLFTPVVSDTIPRFTGGANGQILYLYNAGPGKIVLTHSAGGPGQILTPLNFDYVIQPGREIQLEYIGSAAAWVFAHPTLGAGTTPEYGTDRLLPGAGITITPNGDGSATISNFGAGGGGADIHGWHHFGNWYGWFLGSIVSGAGGGSATTFFACPFLTTQALTTSNIGIQAGNNDVVTHNIRLAIYSNTSQTVLYPNALLLDSGNIGVAPSGGALAPRSTAAVVALPPKLYWLVLAMDDANITYQIVLVPAATSTLIYGLLGAATLRNTLNGGWTVPSGGFGAFPGVFPAIGGATATQGAPFVMVQI